MHKNLLVGDKPSALSLIAPVSMKRRRDDALSSSLNDLLCRVSALCERTDWDSFAERDALIEEAYIACIARNSDFDGNVSLIDALEARGYLEDVLWVAAVDTAADGRQASPSLALSVAALVNRKAQLGRCALAPFFARCAVAPSVRH